MKNGAKRTLFQILAVICVVLAVVFFAVSISAANPHDTYIKKEYVQYCEEIGEQYHVSPELLEAIIEAESSGNADAVSRTGKGIGLMQVHYDLHQDRMKRLGVTDLYDPYSNILVGADILVELFETQGDDLMLVLMKYNGQSNAVTRAETGEFSDYANRVQKRAYELEMAHGKI